MDPAGFDDLGDAEKVKFVNAELPTTQEHLDKLITDYDQTFAALEHPRASPASSWDATAGCAI